MRPDDHLKLEHQLCFSLYTASRVTTKLYRPLLDELGLTYPQYLVMLVLWEADGIMISAVGERLKLDTGTLTPLLKRLESDGLLTRTRDSADERKVVIHLTNRGRELKTRATNVPGQMFCRTGLNMEEFERLKEMLDSLISHIEKNSGT